MKVYVMNINALDINDESLYKYLSDKRIEKVKKLKKAEKKAQSIGAELLLNYAVRQEGYLNTPVQWETDENGKLYLPDCRELYVNLSHSGEYSVCAVNNSPVGVDIQLMTECDKRLAKRFFTLQENEMIEKSEKQKDAFFEIWTKKESFVKTLGCGLTIPLNSFSVMSDTVEYNGNVYRFKEYTVKNSDYKLFTCFLA